MIFFFSFCIYYILGMNHFNNNNNNNLYLLSTGLLWMRKEKECMHRIYRIKQLKNSKKIICKIGYIQWMKRGTMIMGSFRLVVYYAFRWPRWKSQYCWSTSTGLKNAVSKWSKLSRPSMHNFTVLFITPFLYRYATLHPKVVFNVPIISVCWSIR